MARKRFTTEQIIGMLREAEVRLAQGQSIGLQRPECFAFIETLARGRNRWET